MHFAEWEEFLLLVNCFARRHDSEKRATKSFTSPSTWGKRETAKLFVWSLIQIRSCVVFRNKSYITVILCHAFWKCFMYGLGTPDEKHGRVMTSRLGLMSFNATSRHWASDPWNERGNCHLVTSLLGSSSFSLFGIASGTISRLFERQAYP